MRPSPLSLHYHGRLPTRETTGDESAVGPLVNIEISLSVMCQHTPRCGVGQLLCWNLKQSDPTAAQHFIIAIESLLTGRLGSRFENSAKVTLKNGLRKRHCKNYLQCFKCMLGWTVVRDSSWITWDVIIQIFCTLETNREETSKFVRKSARVQTLSYTIS